MMLTDYMYLPTTPLEQEVTQGQFLNRFEIRIFLLQGRLPTKVKEPWQSYDLPIDGGRKVGFIYFLRFLVQCEMQTALLRI